ERLKPLMACGTPGIVQPNGGNCPLRLTGRWRDGCRVHTGGRISDGAMKQIFQHEKPSSHHRCLVPSNRQNTPMGEQSTTRWHRREVVAMEFSRRKHHIAINASSVILGHLIGVKGTLINGDIMKGA